MSAQRIVRQLRREVKANPKRAALLAALMAVGVYFWAPLVAGWVMPDGAATAPAKKVAAKTSSALAAPAPGPAGVQPAKPTNAKPWPQLWAAIQDDKRTKPAATLAAATNPFRPFPAPPEAHEETEDAKATNPTAENGATAANRAAKPNSTTPVEATPKSLGMKLTGTVIGARQRAAVIDGQIVPEGGLVSPTSGDSKPPSAKPDAARIAFRLTRVEDRSIALERNQKKYTLTLETPTIDGIEFELVSPKSQ